MRRRLTLAFSSWAYPCWGFATACRYGWWNETACLSCAYPSIQLANATFGGAVGRKTQREDGQQEISIDPSSPLFAGLDKEQLVLLTHGDSIVKIADGFRSIAQSGDIVAGAWQEREGRGRSFGFTLLSF